MNEKESAANLLEKWRAAERAAYAAGEDAQAAHKAVRDATEAAEAAASAAEVARAALRLAQHEVDDAAGAAAETGRAARAAGAKAESMNHVREDALAAEEAARERYHERERDLRGEGEPSEA